MERPKPVTPDMRPCNNGCPLYGEVAVFGPELAAQINAEQERQLKSDAPQSSGEPVRTEVMQCAKFRAANMCLEALRMHIVRADGAYRYGTGRKMENAPLPENNPYL